MLGFGSTVNRTNVILPSHHNAATHVESMSFDGNGDLFRLADHDDFSFVNDATGNASFSISFWIKREANNENHGIIGKVSTTTTFEYRIFFASSTLYCDIYDTTVGNYTRSQWNNITSTDWMHFTVTYGGPTGLNNFKLYYNGIETARSATGTGGTGGDMENLVGQLFIGDVYDGSTDYFLNGFLCQFMMWNKELGPAEAAYLYNTEAPRDPTKNSSSYSSKGNLIAWWPFDDSDGDEDHSTNSHDLTAAGDASISTGGSNSPFA